MNSTCSSNGARVSETPNCVIDYIVERLADEGIAHCFGAAGDYVFPICNAVDRSSKIKWIGCANGLNASYNAQRVVRQWPLKRQGPDVSASTQRRLRRPTRERLA